MAYPEIAVLLYTV